MTELDEIISNFQSSYSGTLYMLKKKGYYPWQPSGKEGRFSGDGTYAYYFGDSLTTCWNEIKNHDDDAIIENYNAFACPINNGTFIDVGAVVGTRFVQPKSEGGWVPTQELSNRFVVGNILGFRCVSQPSIQKGLGGTCFCIYKSVLSLSEKDFKPINNYEELKNEM